ncbi:MAG: DUF4275 family protein [Ruminococcaceae bacterium]|nr:DUF4275 family protein [Oscillospiraceae bacterium]
MKGKNMEFMDFWEFRRRWLSHFAKGIPQWKIDKYVVETGDYIWHVFSWGLIGEKSFLTGDRAREAFDRLCTYEKENAIFIEPFEDEDSFFLLQGDATSEKLDKYTEIYAMAKDLSWTYIKTHEGDLCGPYFYRKE